MSQFSGIKARLIIISLVINSRLKPHSDHYRPLTDCFSISWSHPWDRLPSILPSAGSFSNTRCEDWEWSAFAAKSWLVDLDWLGGGLAVQVWWCIYWAFVWQLCYFTSSFIWGNVLNRKICSNINMKTILLAICKKREVSRQNLKFWIVQGIHENVFKGEITLTKTRTTILVRNAGCARSRYTLKLIFLMNEWMHESNN